MTRCGYGSEDRRKGEIGISGTGAVANVRCARRTVSGRGGTKTERVRGTTKKLRVRMRFETGETLGEILQTLQIH